MIYLCSLLCGLKLFVNGVNYACLVVMSFIVILWLKVVCEYDIVDICGLVHIVH